jgi:hypothetical protein
VCWSPDGTLLALGSQDTTVSLWIAETGEVRPVWLDPSSQVGPSFLRGYCCVSPTWFHLVTALFGHCIAVCWCMQHKHFTGLHDDWVMSVSFSHVRIFSFIFSIFSFASTCISFFFSILLLSFSADLIRQFIRDIQNKQPRQFDFPIENEKMMRKLPLKCTSSCQNGHLFPISQDSFLNRIAHTNRTVICWPPDRGTRVCQ